MGLSKYVNTHTLAHTPPSSGAAANTCARLKREGHIFTCMYNTLSHTHEHTHVWGLTHTHTCTHTHTYTHTHTFVCIHICTQIFVCLCVCVCVGVSPKVS